MGKEEQPEQPWTFTRKEGDVRYLTYIINIAVQAALTQLKAIPSDSTKVYRMENDAARISHG
jgi:hypothetical protein